MLLMSKGKWAPPKDMKAQLYLLEPPQSHWPNWTDTCPQGSADDTSDCATCSALQRDNLPTWDGKIKLAETRVCSQASLPCPSVVVSCSSRDRGEKGGQKDRGKPERGGGLDTSHPMEVSNHFQLHSWGPGLEDGFSSRYCSPASPLEMDVVASYHFGPLTSRIKLLAHPLLAFPLQRAATVDTKAFESGLTAQSCEH